MKTILNRITITYYLFKIILNKWINSIYMIKDSYRMTNKNDRIVFLKGTLFVPSRNIRKLKRPGIGNFFYTFKLSLIFLITIFYSTEINAQETLEEYLEFAAKNNPVLKSKYNDYLAALEEIPQVSALPDPQLSFAYFIQPVETRLGPQKARISLNQMLPWFGMLGAKEDVKVLQAKAKFEEFEDVKSKLYYEIKSMYYNMYFIEKSLEETGQNIEILKSLNQLVRTKLESGEVSAVDDIYLQMEIAELQNQLILMQDELYTLQVEFNNVLNTDKFIDIKLPDTLVSTAITANKQELKDKLLTANHRIKRLDFLTEAYQREISVSKKSAYPTINLGVDYIITEKNPNIPNLADNGKDAIIFPKIGINIPLFSSKYSARTKQSEFQKISADNKIIATANQLESMFETIYKDWRDAQRRKILYSNQLELSRTAFQILRSQYETGDVGLEDLLNMERKILMYSLSLQKSRKDENTAKAKIDYLMGE